ncbi:MAG TPA: MBL fold metallo-hydrolase [Solirubrobacteraceae bacterium]
MIAALARHGVGPGELVEVYLSHLHNDHAGGLRLLPRHVPVHVQRGALDQTSSATSTRRPGPGGFVHCTPDVPLASLLRLKEIAARESLRRLPGHDPQVWPAFTAELLGPGPPHSSGQ